MSIYSSLAEKLQFILPSFYKQRYFKKLRNLTEHTILEKKVEPELFWLFHYLKKEDVFIDVGANVGAYLYITESLLSPKNIIAFEPNRKLNKRLHRIFKGIRIFPLALSNENSIAEFKVPIVKGKNLHSRGTLQTQLKENDEERSIIEKVRVMRLDDWVEAEKIKKIDFIKIDVEGNEFDTVEGAENTLRTFRPTLMIEIEQRHHTEPIWNFISSIENKGYRAHFLDRKTFQLALLTREIIEKQDPDNVKKHEQYINNIIFTPINECSSKAEF